MNDFHDAGGVGPIYLATVLDTDVWTGLQRRVLVLTAMAVALDGLDNQMLGFIVPALIRDWAADRSALYPSLPRA